MIRCATGREPVYIGKPNPIIVDMCLAQTGFSKEQTLVIGDRLYTDIACGIAGGRGHGGGLHGRGEAGGPGKHGVPACVCVPLDPRAGRGGILIRFS